MKLPSFYKKTLNFQQVNHFKSGAYMKYVIFISLVSF